MFDNQDLGESGEKACCSLESVCQARGVAHLLGIPFYVFNFSRDFRENVIHLFQQPPAPPV